jgi:hypothetical protein
MKKLMFAFTTIALLLAANLYADEIVVIVNGRGPLTGISKEDIREIYLGTIRFKGKVKYVPLNYSEGVVKNAFLLAIVGKTSKEYRLHWTKKIFRDGITSTSTLKNYKLIKLTVQKYAGAIGYLPRSELNDTKGIQIIATINR